jgi:prepilin-type N-terminal cleavage/methylation domain-containing protein
MFLNRGQLKMSFTDIKTRNQGFTIVELLIVVVVIAILAAITIVSYTGITNRANAAAAQETASNLQKKIETYAADNTAGESYPRTLAALTAAGFSYSTPPLWNTDTSNGKSINMTPSASTAANVAGYQICGRANTGSGTVAAPGSATAAAMPVVTGYRISSWNFGSPAGVTFQDTGVVSGTQVVSGVTYNIGCVAPTS